MKTKNFILLFVMSLFAFSLAQGQCIVKDPRILYPQKEVFRPDPRMDHPKRPDQLDFSGQYDYPLDQGDQGSCVGQAITEGMSYQKAFKIGWNFRAHNSSENLAHHLSPAFVYNPLVGPQPGLEFTDALEYVCQNGGVPLSVMPYNQKDDTTQPTNTMFANALYYCEDSWGYTKDLETALNLLYQYGSVYTSFHHASGSNHAVVLVGYDDFYDNGDGTFGAWKYANSVGRGWGEDGFGWISYLDPWLDNSDYFYLVERPDHRPALVYKFDFNLGSKAKAFSLGGGDNRLSHFYFLNGTDTIKKIDLAPMLDNFFLPIEFRSDIGSANRLVIESDIIEWVSSPHDWGFNMKFSSVSTYDWSAGTFNELKFDTVSTHLVLDSLIYGVGNNSYQIFNGFNVSIDLTANNSGVVEKNGMGLFSNYPNPAHDQTTFVFSLTEESQIGLQIMNSSGVVLTNLEKTLAAGEQRLNLALNLPAGLYLAKLTVGHEMLTRKFLVK